MAQIELTSELNCKLIDSMGSDLSIVNAARVSFDQHQAAKNADRQELSEKDAGLVNFLMKNHHTSPFEHTAATFLIECPIVVVREWHRHRTQSYNEMSGRYTQLEPKFYAPNYDRPLIQVGKPGAYRFEVPKDDIVNINLYRELRYSYQAAWNAYEILLEQGVAKEVARLSLPVAVYTKFYATANLLNWMRFLTLRTDAQAMFEIRELAFKVEEHLFRLYPAAMTCWDKNGRAV